MDQIQSPPLARGASFWQRALPRLPQWLLMIGALVTLFVALIGANLLGFRLRSSTLFMLDVGAWGDQDQLRGVYQQEKDATGATYRWTQAESAFFVRDFAAVRYPELRVHIGGLPQSAGGERTIGFVIDNADLAVPVVATARQYHLMLPTNALADGDLDLAMTTTASVDPPDQRAVGMRLDDITLGWSVTGWSLPTLPLLLVQAAIVLVWLGVAWRLELPRSVWPLLVLGSIGLLGLITSAQLMVAMAWETRLLATSVLLFAVAWRSYAWIERMLPGLLSRWAWRWLLLITVLAIGVHVFAIMFPPFGSHDLYIHKQRLHDVQLGWLQLFDTPSEFAGRRTVVPPAFYIIAQPLTLLTNDPGVALQGLYTVLEGTSPLLIAVVVRQLGGSTRAALIAALLIASLPIQITILWWGFGPQVLSQWLLLLLLVLLTRRPPDRVAGWLCATLILSVAFLAHNGAMILGGLALGGYLALLWLRHRHDRSQWLGWGSVVVASGVLAVLLVYGDVIASQLASVGGGASNVEPSAAEEWARIGRIWGGLRSSFRPLDFALPSVLGFVLPIASVIVLLVRTKGPQRWLIAAWLASGLLFLVIDVVLGLQVRYAYFVIPLLCAGVGLTLDWLMAQRVLGRVAGMAIVAFVCVAGLHLWTTGVFLGIKPTLTALTH